MEGASEAEGYARVTRSRVTCSRHTPTCHMLWSHASPMFAMAHRTRGSTCCLGVGPPMITFGEQNMASVANGESSSMSCDSTTATDDRKATVRLPPPRMAMRREEEAGRGGRRRGGRRGRGSGGRERHREKERERERGERGGVEGERIGGEE